MGESKNGEREKKRERGAMSPPSSEEERRRETLAQRNRTMEPGETPEMPMLIDEEQPEGTQAKQPLFQNPRPLEHFAPREVPRLEPSALYDENLLAWIEGVDEERGHVLAKVGQIDGQLLQQSQILSNVANGHLNFRTELNQVLAHFQKIDTYIQNLDRTMHTLAEEQQMVKQEIQRNLQTGVAEPALKFIKESAQVASAELEVKTETLLNRLQHGWSQERMALRESILQEVLAHQPPALTMEELNNIKESARAELQNDLRHFMTFLDHEKTLLDQQRSMGSGDPLPVIEKRILEVIDFCHGAKAKMEGSENFVTQLKGQVDTQAQVMHALMGKISEWDNRLQTLPQGPLGPIPSGDPKGHQQISQTPQISQRDPAGHAQNLLATDEVLELRAQNARLNSQLQNLQNQAIPTVATGPRERSTPDQSQAQPLGSQDPGRLPSRKPLPTCVDRLREMPSVSSQYQSRDAPGGTQHLGKGKGGLLDTPKFIDDDEEGGLPYTTPFCYPARLQGSVPCGARSAEVRVGESQSRGVHPANQWGMFPFASPLQQHAQQFLQPPHFDGQPKNWPVFIRK